MNIQSFVRRAIVPAALTLAAVAGLSAQPLAVKKGGVRNVVISDRVGKNQFNWTSDAPGEKILGTSEGVTGTLKLDPKNIATLRGTISTKVATMKTGNDMRDDHLRSAMWLDAEKFPAITFTVTSVKNVKVNGSTATADAVGEFTMHGVTKTLTIPFTLQYLEESSKTKERAPGDLVMISADFSVALKDYAVAGREGVIGSKVGEKIAITAKLYGSTGL